MSKTNGKNSKTNSNTAKTKKMEEIMKSAEVKIENPAEMKERRIRHSFNDSILLKIDNRAKDLNEEDYKPIREKIASALNELQKIINDNNDFIRTERALRFKLSKFSKEQIENYLKHLN